MPFQHRFYTADGCQYCYSGNFAFGIGQHVAFENIGKKQVGRSEADAGRMVLNEVLQNKGLITAPGTPVMTVENGVKKQKVTFHNRFLIDIVGDLYFPANYDSTKRYPTLIVGHPFGGVKEQTSGLYARKLAESGYVTLAIRYGAGIPRFHHNRRHQMPV